MIKEPNPSPNPAPAPVTPPAAGVAPGSHVKPLPPARETPVLRQFFPQRADNAYRGNRFAPWFFALVVLLKVYVSLNSIFNGHLMAGSGDRIPLDALTPAGAQTVVSLFALWGLAQLTICLLCLLVLFRYRAMIPLMFALLLLEHLGRKLIIHFLPFAKAGLGGDSVGISPFPYGFLVLIIIGLVLSLRARDNPREQE
jgi:hypothetical protein